MQAVLEYCGVGTEELTSTRAPGTGELMKKWDHPRGSGIMVAKHQNSLFRDIFETYFGNFNWERYSTQYSVSPT